LERAPYGARTFSRKEKDMTRAKMSEKRGTKKATTKTASKKTPVKSTARKTAGMQEGCKYTCGVCGLTVSVDTACGCAETGHITCCEKPMMMKK